MAYQADMGDGMEMEGDNTFYLPPDFPNSESLSTGDTITLKVVSKSDDGEIEVTPIGGATDNWKSDLRKTMSAETEEEPEMED